MAEHALGQVNPRASYVAAIILSAMFMTLCAFAAGASLGVFIGGLIAVSLIAPPLTAHLDYHSALILAVLLCATIVASWIITCAGVLSMISIAQAAMVLASFAVALIATIQLLRLARLQPLAACAFATVLAIAWLTWPIWLSPVMNAVLARRLVSVSPLLAMNRAVSPSEAWSHLPVAYSLLTNLDQDVPAGLPGSVWPDVWFHALMALLLGLVVTAEQKQKRRGTKKQC